MSSFALKLEAPTWFSGLPWHSHPIGLFTGVLRSLCQHDDVEHRTVFIIGSTGYIGRRLIPLLLTG